MQPRGTTSFGVDSSADCAGKWVQWLSRPATQSTPPQNFHRRWLSTVIQAQILARRGSQRRDHRRRFIKPGNLVQVTVPAWMPFQNYLIEHLWATLLPFPISNIPTWLQQSCSLIYNLQLCQVTLALTLLDYPQFSSKVGEISLKTQFQNTLKGKYALGPFPSILVI
jgi:hypothetical protein